MQSSALAPAQQKPWLRLRLVLISVDPATHPTVKVYFQTLNTSYRSNSILIGRQPHMKTTSQEDNLTGRRPHRKTTSQEDKFKGRRPNRKTTSQEKTSQEEDLNGRRPQWKTTLMEDEFNGRRLQWKTTSFLVSSMTRF